MQRIVSGLWFLLGTGLAVVSLAGLAEVFLRMCPPADLQPYLGEESRMTGIYRSDDDVFLTYRSWETFCEDNAQRLQPPLALHRQADGRPLWAFFGNSFVHAPGMLADQARQTVTDRQIFNLGRNEPFCLRMAQIKLLLEHGMKPDRIFFEVMPIDVVDLGEQPLDTLYPTSRGALTYRPRLAGGRAGWLLQNSRLALTAWVRTGRHRGNPDFDRNAICKQVDPRLLADLRRLFGNLARIAEQHQVPVTVMLLPTHEQVTRGFSYRFQDTLGEMLRRQGYDVFDPRAPFNNHRQPAGLFLPDKHYNLAGNQILLSELLRHCEAQRAMARKPAGAAPR